MCDQCVKNVFVLGFFCHSSRMSYHINISPHMLFTFFKDVCCLNTCVLPAIFTIEIKICINIEKVSIHFNAAIPQLSRRLGSVIL